MNDYQFLKKDYAPWSELESYNGVTKYFVLTENKWCNIVTLLEEFVLWHYTFTVNISSIKNLMV